jgi:hypothetical protein
MMDCIERQFEPVRDAELVKNVENQLFASELAKLKVSPAAAIPLNSQFFRSRMCLSIRRTGFWYLERHGTSARPDMTLPGRAQWRLGYR